MKVKDPKKNELELFKKTKFLLCDQMRDLKGELVKELRFRSLSNYPEYLEAGAFVDDQNAKAVGEMTMIEFHSIELSELD